MTEWQLAKECVQVTSGVSAGCNVVRLHTVEQRPTGDIYYDIFHQRNIEEVLELTGIFFMLGHAILFTEYANFDNSSFKGRVHSEVSIKKIK